jgi:hypothetical protein
MKYYKNQFQHWILWDKFVASDDFVNNANHPFISIDGTTLENWKKLIGCLAEIPGDCYSRSKYIFKFVYILTIFHKNINSDFCINNSSLSEKIGAAKTPYLTKTIVDLFLLLVNYETIILMQRDILSPDFTLALLLFIFCYEKLA